MTRQKFNEYLFQFSAVLVLIGAALYMPQPDTMKYIFAVGAAGFTVARLSFHYQGKNKRLARLYSMQKFSGLLLIGASYSMFKPIFFGERNSWIMLICIAAVLELYSSFIISRIEKKEKQEPEN